MTKHRLKRLPRVCVVAGCMVIVPPQLQSSEVQVGRYSIQSATPTEAQTDLLAVTVATRIPDRIQTIGDSVRYLLRQSGYRLANSVAISPETNSLFLLPLPAVHRHLGPIPLRRALETLAGSTFRLVQDPVHRFVSFELCTKEWADLTRSETTVKFPHRRSAGKSLTTERER